MPGGGRGAGRQKIDPATVATLSLDAVAAGQAEILADDPTRRIKAGLAA